MWATRSRHHASRVAYGSAGQQELVGAHHVALPGQRQTLGLGGRALGQERVVVEQEHRHDGRRAALLGPHRERMLGRDDAHLVAHVDQVVVAGLAEDLHRVLVGGPQLVVARHPDHLGEPLAQQIQRPADLVGAFGDVAGDDQPVVGGRRVQRLGDRLVAGVTGVQVADRPQRRSPSVRDGVDTTVQPTGAVPSSARPATRTCSRFAPGRARGLVHSPAVGRRAAEGV